MSSIAACLNPFYMENSEAGTLDIYSGLDGVFDSGLTISNVTGSEKYTHVFSDDTTKDISCINIYASKVNLVTDLILPGRTLRIYCDRLTVFADAKTIDVSPVWSTADKTSYDRPLSPPPISNGTPASGDEYIKDNVPNDHWGKKGASSGELLIVCNVLELLGNSFSLKSNGADGYPGCNGQSCTYSTATPVGGDASSGGAGGDGGNVRCNYATLIATSAQAIEASAAPGNQGQDGIPGYAGDVARVGSAAQAGVPGVAGDASVCQITATFPDTKYDPIRGAKNSTTMPDLSEIAFAAPMTFWNMLYHRVKIAYIQNQATGYKAGSYPAGWQAMKPVIEGAYYLTQAYSSSTLVPTTDISKDIQNKQNKATIAAQIGVMKLWYDGGKCMWGNDVTYVDNLPWEAKIEQIANGYQAQRDVRDMYLRIRKDFDKELADVTARAAVLAQFDSAISLHSQIISNLRTQLVGVNSKNTSDATSLQYKLLTAQTDCEKQCDSVKAALKEFKIDGEKYYNVSASDIVEGLQSMAFVIGDPFGAGLCAGLTAYKGVNDGLTTIKDNDGNTVSKSVLQSVSNMSEDLGDAANTCFVIGGDADAKNTQLVVGSLDQIESFVKDFTSTIGAAQTVVDDIKVYRNLIQKRVDLLVLFSNVAAQIVAENVELQKATDAKAAVSAYKSGDLNDELQMVNNCAHIYLTQLESSADAIAWLKRKYFFTTLDTHDLSNNYVGSSTAFWSADAAGFTPDDSLDNTISGNFVTVDAYQANLDKFWSDQPSLCVDTDYDIEAAPLFYVTIDGATDIGKAFLTTLLPDPNGKVTKDEKASFMVEAGDVKLVPPGTSENVVIPPSFLLQNGDGKFNIRVTNMLPWIEGISTATQSVIFTIERDNTCWIEDSSKEVSKFCFVDGLVTGFKHNLFTDATHTTPTDVMNPTTNAANGRGVFTMPQVDTRGVYGKYTLVLPGIDDPTSDNYQLTYADIEKVKMRIYFWGKYQTKAGVTMTKPSA